MENTLISAWNNGTDASVCLTFILYVSGTPPAKTVTVEVRAVLERTGRENVSYDSQVKEIDRWVYHLVYNEHFSQKEGRSIREQYPY